MNSRKKLCLKKIVSNSKIELDTIERYNNDSLLLVSINKYGFLGNFSTHCGFVRKTLNGIVIYELIDFDRFVLSKEYIANQTSRFENQRNWGWFTLENHKFTNLPEFDKLFDSLKHEYSRNYFVTHNDYGIFTIFDNGALIKQYNYGNIILKDSTINFNELPFGLYKIVNNTLCYTSKNPDSIFKIKSGTYFVSKPGFGLEKKIMKKEVSKILMSYSTISDCPEKINISYND